MSGYKLIQTNNEGAVRVIPGLTNRVRDRDQSVRLEVLNDDRLPFAMATVPTLELVTALFGCQHDRPGSDLRSVIIDGHTYWYEPQP